MEHDSKHACYCLFPSFIGLLCFPLNKNHTALQPEYQNHFHLSFQKLLNEIQNKNNPSFPTHMVYSPSLYSKTQLHLENDP